jgi:hypothetical protein
MVKLGKVIVRSLRLCSSPQVPSDGRITRIWHLMTTSLLPGQNGPNVLVGTIRGVIEGDTDERPMPKLRSGFSLDRQPWRHRVMPGLRQAEEDPFDRGHSTIV